MLYTWDYLVERADGKAHLSPELKAKDNAREQVRELALSFGERDIEDFECPEDMVEEYCKMFSVMFSENGDIASCKKEE
jgi:hypothetical protein